MTAPAPRRLPPRSGDEQHRLSRLDLTPHVIPPHRLAEHLPPGVTVLAAADTASDTAAFSARRGEAEHHAAAMSLGSRRRDVNGAVRSHLAARKVPFADRGAALTMAT